MTRLDIATALDRPAYARALVARHHLRIEEFVPARPRAVNDSYRRALAMCPG